MNKLLEGVRSGIPPGFGMNELWLHDSFQTHGSGPQLERRLEDSQIEALSTTALCGTAGTQATSRRSFLQ